LQKEEGELTLWKKRYLRNELGWVRIFKKNSKNAECILDVVASDIMDIGVPLLGSKPDRDINTLILLIFKDREMVIGAETIKVGGFFYVFAVSEKHLYVSSCHEI
jgi:hypothetical protein